MGDQGPLSIVISSHELREMATELKKLYPEILADLLGNIGAAGAKHARENLLSGQKITFRNGGNGQWKDRTGRHKISWWLTRKAGGVVRISSYPLNFPQYRKIMTVELRSAMPAIIRERALRWEKRVEREFESL